jgi:hypothetical protein
MYDSREAGTGTLVRWINLSRTRIVCKANGSEKYITRPTIHTAELASMSHFIAPEKVYPDDSVPESCSMPIHFGHFDVKIEVVQVVHVEEVA